MEKDLKKLTKQLLKIPIKVNKKNQWKMLTDLVSLRVVTPLLVTEKAIPQCNCITVTLVFINIFNIINTIYKDEYSYFNFYAYWNAILYENFGIRAMQVLLVLLPSFW